MVITLFWALTAAVTAALGVLGVLTGTPDPQVSTGARVAARTVYAALWWTTTIAAVAASELVTLRRADQYGVMLFHALLAALVAVVWPLAAYALNLSLVPGWNSLGGAVMVAATHREIFMVYLFVTAIVHAVIFSREYRARELLMARAEAGWATARLQALKMEIRPHFLFNTLNGVSALMRRDLQAADLMLTHLADFLRASLSDVHEQEVPLARELESLRSFSALHRMRSENAIRIAWEVDPATLDADVPHLILLPLVENAIVHGLRGGHGTITVAARIRSASLELEVHDDGSARHTAPAGFGLGIPNTVARLDYLYGPRARFELVSTPGGGSTARISLPIDRPPRATDDLRPSLVRDPDPEAAPPC